MNITDFLWQRWAEEEVLALALSEPQHSWTWTPNPEHPTYEGEVPEIYLYACNTQMPYAVEFAAGAHIAHHDPAHVLADIAAKRALLKLANEASGLDMQVDGEFRVGLRDTSEEPYVGDLILRHFATPYSDHPDYRGEWKP